MKKLMIIALALIFMVPAISVFAGELTIGGSYRLTWTKYDPGIVDTGTDDRDNFQQRLRIPFTWKANDNVSFFMRTDWTEGGWLGRDQFTADIAVDYMFATIAHDFYTLRVGLHERAWSNYMMYDPDLCGFALDLRPAEGMTLSFDYGKQSEGGNVTDSTAAGTNDRDIYAMKFEYASDVFTVGGMIAQTDGTGIEGGTNKDAFKRGYGVYVTVPKIADMVTIVAELNILDGDNGLDGLAEIDYYGTQFLFDAGMALSETIAIGFTAVYAKGDDDADKQQVTNVDTGGASFASPLDFGGALRYDEAYGFGVMTTNLFELGRAAGAGYGLNDTGILGGAFRIQAKLADPVTLYAKAGWFATEEDEVWGAGTDLEDVMFFNVSVDYAWQPNVTLSLGALYMDFDFNDEPAGFDSEKRTALVARLGINF